MTEGGRPVHAAGRRPGARRAAALLLFAALAALSGCAARLPAGARDKGLESARSTRAEVEASLGPRRLALLIGVDRYEDPVFPPLRFASRDAADLAAVLRSEKYGGFERVVTLTRPEEISRARIIKEIANLRADARREDSVVVYFSGHGTMAFAGTERPRLYLVAGDSQVSDLPGTALDLADLQEIVTGLRAERKALVVDACFDGLGKSSVPKEVRERSLRLGSASNLSSRISLGQSEAHLFATTWGRPAREDDALQHGVYTYFLVQALNWEQKAADTNGDGLVSVYEAHDFARGKTVAYTQAAQVPEAYFRVVGERDLYLVGDVTRRAATEMGLIYFYGDGASEYADASLSVDGRFKGAFPGTYAIPPGEHRIAIRSGTGRMLFDRVVGIQAGSSVVADRLTGSPPPRRVAASLAGGARFALDEGMLGLTGRSVPGLEGRVTFRPGHGRWSGLTLSAVGGWGRTGSLAADGDPAGDRRRDLGSVGIALGWRWDRPRFGFGIAWSARAHFASSLPGGEASCGGAAGCDGFAWPSQGLLLDQSLPLVPGRLGLVLTEDFQLALVDVGTGARWISASAAVRLGVEVAF